MAYFLLNPFVTIPENGNIIFKCCRMNKLVSFLLISALLAACNNSGNNTTPSTDSSDARTNVTTETGDSIDMKNVPDLNRDDTSTNISGSDTDKRH